MASTCCIPVIDDCADCSTNGYGGYSCQYSSSGNIDGAPPDIKMGVKTGPHGLHAVATEDIRAGTVIAQCLPLAQSPIIHGPAKPTCFRCFFQEGDDDLSGRRKTETLFRCSRCQIARYCSKECQMSDWNEGHKLECQFYVKQRKIQHNSSASSLDEEAAMPKALMLRVFAALKLLRDKQSVEDSMIKAAVRCGPNHFSSLAVSPQHLSPSKSTKVLKSSEMKIVKSIMMQHAIGKGKQKDSSKEEQTTAVVQIWGYNDNRTNDGEMSEENSYTLDQALLRTDDAFRKNNFGILDALHSSIGEGVYPCAALLNHSCAPNAILRYKLDSGDNMGKGKGKVFHPPLLQIVACRDIVKGEELTHSYVDLMLSTKERQARLLKTHGFTCECKRCVEGEYVVSLPQDRTLWEKWPLEHRLRVIDQGEGHGEDNHLVSIDLETALNQCDLGERDRAAIVDCADFLSGQAQQSMLRDDVEEELSTLRDAINLWKDKDIDWWWTPFNLPLYSSRSQYFTALLANQEITEAVDQLEFIVSTLIVAFSHVQHHPLLGLQLFTLGDLYAYMERSRACGRKAYLTYFYAKEVMTITHGVDHPMVLQLDQKLAEHANAKWVV